MLGKLIAKFRDPKQIIYSLQWRWFLIKDGKLDRKYGIDTAGIQDDLSALGAKSKNIQHGYGYEPVQLKTFSDIISFLPDDRESFKFIDLGSGKGRALILAGIEGYRHCIGVEFAKELCVIAQSNIDKVQSKLSSGVNFEIHLQDAAEFQFPSCDLILFLYNPFNETVLSKVLQNLKQSQIDSKNRILIVYRNPVHQNFFENYDWLQVAHRAKGFIVYSRI